MRLSPVRVILCALLTAAAPVAGAQERTVASASRDVPVPRPANDSLFRRARRMVLDGNGAAGRALVDSLLAAAAPGSATFGEALYWHGALASSASDAERDYRRVIVEYPLTFYADDALLALAELEQGRGDHAAALAHLQRFVHEHPASPARGIAALGAARLAFDQQHDTKLACAMLAEARASVGTKDVELNNQIAYYTPRCPAPPPATVARMGTVATAAATPVDTQSSATRSGVPRVAPDPLPAVPDAPRPAPSTAPAAVPTSTTAKSVVPATATARGRYTIQLAAYNTRPEAERMAATLGAKGLPARVSGTAKPFRVRLAFYPTRAAAAEEVKALRARGIVGFVTVEEGERR